jgi:hypothetical protein
MLRLSYAITAHSSQGTESPRVIYALNKSFHGCSRLMNVGITRTKEKGCLFFFTDNHPRNADISKDSTLHKFVENGFSQRHDVLGHCLVSALGHVLVALPPMRATKTPKEAFTQFPPYCEFERRKQEQLPVEIPGVFDGMTEKQRQERAEEEAARAIEKRRRLQPKKRTFTQVEVEDEPLGPVSAPAPVVPETVQVEGGDGGGSSAECVPPVPPVVVPGPGVTTTDYEDELFIAMADKVQRSYESASKKRALEQSNAVLDLQFPEDEGDCWDAAADKDVAGCDWEDEESLFGPIIPVKAPMKRQRL